MALKRRRPATNETASYRAASEREPLHLETNSTTRDPPTDKVRVMSRLSGQVYDFQTKSADLSETRAVRGSGLVGSVQWN